MLAFDAQGDDEESSLPHLDHGFSSKLPPGYLNHGLPTVKDVAPAITPLEQKKEQEEKKEGKSQKQLRWGVNPFSWRLTPSTEG